jgi:imidazolonepropionase-like amidohydrolase
MNRRKGLAGLAAGTLAALLAAAPCDALGQRAASFHERVRQYVAHDAATIRIDNVRVIDGTGAPALAGQSLFIREGKIAAIGPSGTAGGQAADLVIDGRGRTVTPGLVMMHEHLIFLDPLATDVPSYLSEPLAAPLAYLAWGATTIRTAGTFNGIEDIQVARRIREGQFAGPEVRPTAPFLEGDGSFAYQMLPITDPARARAIVDFWADAGATSFKLYNTLTREVLAAAIGQAHARGLKVTGHLCSVTLGEAAAAGIDNLEHGLAVATDFVPRKEPDRCPSWADTEKSLLALDANGPEIAALVATLVARKVAVTSTLAVFAAGVVDWFPAADDLALLNAQSQLWALRRLASLQRAPEKRGKAARLLKLEMQFERAFAAAGGVLLAGTDPTGWGGTLPGPGNHAALRLLAEAGFTPLEVIRIATLNGARFQGIDARVGTLAPGMQADLLLVDGRPDEDIRQLERIDLVFRDGIAYTAKPMRESLRGRIGR